MLFNESFGPRTPKEICNELFLCWQLKQFNESRRLFLFSFLSFLFLALFPIFSVFWIFFSLARRARNKLIYVQRQARFAPSAGLLVLGHVSHLACRPLPRFASKSL